MNDIGMSPDYRSGQPELITCHVCEQAWPDWLMDNCAECCRQVCMECSDINGIRVICIDCLVEPES